MNKTSNQAKKSEKPPWQNTNVKAQTGRISPKVNKKYKILQLSPTKCETPPPETPQTPPRKEKDPRLPSSGLNESMPSPIINLDI